ncbi:MAG: hypothetical protein IT530_16295 [Burkholderiales bacterium]|nr:hypothetical protein [Burkholderiales bacterium]
MEWAAWIADRSVPAFVVILFALQYAARELGLRLARRRVAREGGRPEEVNVLVGGMLGLLAFVLALTLAFANGRFQERRDATLAEANAISSAWARAVAIGHPRGDAIAARMTEYARLRVEYVAAPLDAPTLKALTDRTVALQADIWGDVAALVRERTDSAATSVMVAVDDTFGQTLKVRFTFSSRMPEQIFWLLIGMSTVTMAALGYQIGLRGQTLRMLSFLLIGMWTVVIVDILDLSSARVGTMRNATNAYDWVLEGFAPHPSGR